MNSNLEISNPDQEGLVMPNQLDLQQLLIPPSVDNSNVGENGLGDEDLDIDELIQTTPFQKGEISKIRNLLKKAYEDAPQANLNEDIHRLIAAPWHTAKFPTFMSENKSLAYVLHMEKGWTAASMKQNIGKAPIPFTVRPMSTVESRFLWNCLRYSIQQDTQLFKPDIPGNWLTDDMHYKEVTKTCVVKYAKKVAGIVAWNQFKFIGKGEHWFRCLCEEAGLLVKGNFVSRGWLIIIFVICANAGIFEESTKEIEGSWGKSANRGEVVKALTSAVKKAERDNAIAYPETFKLFKFLFPKILK